MNDPFIRISAYRFGYLSEHMNLDNWSFAAQLNHNNTFHHVCQIYNANLITNRIKDRLKDLNKNDF